MPRVMRYLTLKEPKVHFTIYVCIFKPLKISRMMWPSLGHVIPCTRGPSIGSRMPTRFLPLQSKFLGSKRKRSQKDDDTSGLQDVYDKIEEVVLASQGLQQVISAVKELSELSSQTPAFTEVQTKKIKAVFTCIVCKGPIDHPVFATCCRSLIGCKLCVDQWMATASQCLKCREENNFFLAAGLSEALLSLSDIIKVE